MSNFQNELYNYINKSPKTEHILIGQQPTKLLDVTYNTLKWLLLNPIGSGTVVYFEFGNDEELSGLSIPLMPGKAWVEVNKPAFVYPIYVNTTNDNTVIKLITWAYYD